ncbi:MAG: PSP1 domain-containing protein [Christensenellales bacterium]|jgi:cell fate regulator YaaT (PSP1 superfamily)
MIKVIGVRFRQSGKVYYFDPFGQDVKRGDGVIVETAKGVEYGEVTMEPTEVEESTIVPPLRPIIRVANDNDRATLAQNEEKEKEAAKIAEQKIIDHKLDMKLVGVEYAFNGSKITFYFTADGRVDFRELVKDLAGVFKTRIELRQIGVRDEAKLLGGIGPCGKVVCCKSFLTEFHPVSIKMAKEQSLSLSPTKISGLCGRLMCCLKYEQDWYEDARKRMPRVGREVITPDGSGTVMENNLLRERVKVKVLLPDGTFDLREYPLSDIKREEPKHDFDKGRNHPHPREDAEDEDLTDASDLPELDGE